MLELQLAASVNDVGDTINNLTSVIYELSEIPVAESLLKNQVVLEETPLVLLKAKQLHSQSSKDSENSSYFMALRVFNYSSGADAQQIQNIRRVIGLSDRVIGVELSSQAETIVERIFLQVLGERYGFEEQDVQIRRRGSKEDNRFTLNFINKKYKKIYSRVNEGIFYHKKQQDLVASTILSKIVEQEFQPDTPATENKSNPVAVVPARNQYGEISAKLTVGEVLSIYKHCLLMEKDTFPIKLAMMKYKALEVTRNKINSATTTMFEKQSKDYKLMAREIKELNLPAGINRRLEWRSRQMLRYQELLKEDQKNIEYVRNYKNSPIYDLPIEVINLEIRYFYRSWITSTLSELKKEFNKIANRRDTKAIHQFRQVYGKALSKLGECKLSKEILPSNKEQIQKMKEQIEDFICYHEHFIKGEYASGLRYMRKQVGYHWRNHPKLFYRIALFLLIAYLAYLQNNLIYGLTILSIGFIVSAINY